MQYGIISHAEFRMILEELNAVVSGSAVAAAMVGVSAGDIDVYVTDDGALERILDWLVLLWYDEDDEAWPFGTLYVKERGRVVRFVYYPYGPKCIRIDFGPRPPFPVIPLDMACPAHSTGVHERLAALDLATRVYGAEMLLSTCKLPPGHEALTACMIDFVPMDLQEDGPSISYQDHIGLQQVTFPPRWGFAAWFDMPGCGVVYDLANKSFVLSPASIGMLVQRKVWLHVDSIRSFRRAAYMDEKGYHFVVGPGGTSEWGLTFAPRGYVVVDAGNPVSESMYMCVKADRDSRDYADICNSPTLTSTARALQDSDFITRNNVLAVVVCRSKLCEMKFGDLNHRTVLTGHVSLELGRPYSIDMSVFDKERSLSCDRVRCASPREDVVVDVIFSVRGSRWMPPAFDF